jgi:hypothetical protein
MTGLPPVIIGKDLCFGQRRLEYVIEDFKLERPVFCRSKDEHLLRYDPLPIVREFNASKEAANAGLLGVASLLLERTRRIAMILKKLGRDRR